jgi:hypothetical protein
MTVSYRPLFERLAAECVDVIVIGGFAAVSLGVPYITQDIDLCYNSEQSNIARLAAALSPLHPRLRVSGMTDEEACQLPFQFDEQTLRQTPILTLRTDAGDLDLMSSVPGIGSFDQVRAAAVEVEVFGHRIPVLDLPGLIASKRAAGRPKDMLALPQIEAALRLRERQGRKNADE